MVIPEPPIEPLLQCPRPLLLASPPRPPASSHIGGGRTALFIWLYAGRRAGRCCCVSRHRSRTFHRCGNRCHPRWSFLAWPGLGWRADFSLPGPPSSRGCRGDAVTGQGLLLYATQQELEEMRELARKEGRPPRYDGRCVIVIPPRLPGTSSRVIRLRAPTVGETVIHDDVQDLRGPTRISTILYCCADGTPTYMLAVVIDDHGMGVTHIIRGEDHLPMQRAKSRSMRRWVGTRPAWRTSAIHGPDGAKLSKRHGALGVDAYRAMGYLPAAMRNYLVRLSWSHGNQEFLDRGNDRQFRHRGHRQIGCPLRL